MLHKSRSMLKKTLSIKNKVFLHASNRQDKNNIFERIFYIKGTWEENKKGVSNSPQWDGFLKVLSASDLAFISLVGVENSDKHRTQRDLTKKMTKNATMIMAQSQTKSLDPEWYNRQQKVRNGRKNPPIYNKILGHSRSWCLIKITLTKSRSTFYGIFYYICWWEKVFDLGRIPLFVNNK